MIESMKESVTRGLYRHFKGNYYFVTNIALNCVTEKLEVCYVDACRPGKTFTRDIEDFFSEDVFDRKDNVTGQYKRFEKVSDLNFEVSSISTPQLLKEIQNRPDSPLHGLSVEEVNSNVFSVDYVTGIPIYLSDEESQGYLSGWNSFETYEEAVNYLNKTTTMNPRTKIFKKKKKKMD